MPLKNPYGLLHGVPAFIDDVDRGKACNCICPSCGHPLIANKGDSKQDYFSHASGSECGAGYQTALHMIAKDILLEEKKLLLPKLVIKPDDTVWKKGTKGKFVTLVKAKIWEFDTVTLEKKLGDIIPDVVLELGEKKLLVEIKVTHGIDEVKLAKIEALGISTIEFDFSQASRVISKDDLKLALIERAAPYGLGQGRWVYHRYEREAQEKSNREYLEQLPKPVVAPPPIVMTTPPALGPPPLPKKQVQREFL